MLDADQDGAWDGPPACVVQWLTGTSDVLARLSNYLLVEPHPSFTPLLQPLFTERSIPDLAITILLDWSEPWNWLRQLREWIIIIRTITNAAGGEIQDGLEANTRDWLQRKKGPKAETAISHDYDATLPVKLGPGEWDEPLGVPLCVVCQNAEKIEILEREHGWKEHEFDTVLVYMRTVLLKHGASLIYTASAAPGHLPALLRSTLDIHSVLQGTLLRHNVNDRDKVLVPPNWDSWGKIRALREEFDFELVSRGWSIDVQIGVGAAEARRTSPDGRATLAADSAVASYQQLIPDPRALSNDAEKAESEASDAIEVQCESNQAFFARQMEVLDRYKAEDEAATRKTKSAASRDGKKTSVAPARHGESAGRLSDHVGPVQFNMGGIQVDADQVLESLRSRGAGTLGRASSPPPSRADGASSPFVASPDGKDGGSEALRSFFAGLASKGGASASSSPRAGPK